MKHRVKGYHLNRDVKHRRSLYKNLVSSLIEHGQIKTTETKAKAVRGLIDRLMVKAQDGSMHKQRQIDSVLNQRALVHRLVHDLAPQSAKRKSGFTRLVKLGQRRGDNAMMVRLELVDYQPAAKVESKKEVDKKPSPPTKTTKPSAPTTKAAPKKQAPKSSVTTKSTTARKQPATKSKGKSS